MFLGVMGKGCYACRQGTGKNNLQPKRKGPRVRLGVRFQAELPSTGTDKCHCLTPACLVLEEAGVGVCWWREQWASWFRSLGAGEEDEAVPRIQRGKESWDLNLLFSNL